MTPAARLTSSPLLRIFRAGAVTFYKELLTKRNRINELAIGDDYRELAECALIV